MKPGPYAWPEIRPYVFVFELIFKFFSELNQCDYMWRLIKKQFLEKCAYCKYLGIKGTKTDLIERRQKSRLKNVHLILEESELFVILLQPMLGFL